jgi:U5 small nuclear ribonucleoprotein component
MDENYDEFGNYIGPDMPEINDDEYDDKPQNINQKGNAKKISSDEDDDFDEDDKKTEKNLNIPDIEINPNKIISEQNKYNVILNEEKELFPDEDEVFPDAENLVMEEDAQPITVPVVNPKKENKFDLFETSLPNLTFNFEFLGHLMTMPKLVRNVSIAGSLQHGKTSFMDMFIHYTHNNPTVVKYLDNREDEQKRRISLKSSPISLVLQNLKEKVIFLISLILQAIQIFLMKSRALLEW